MASKVMIRLLSVPHSGTRFLMDVFDRAGVEYDQRHFSGFNNPPVDELEGPVIIPLRKRDEVLASWRRRGKGYADFAASWAAMTTFADDNHVTFIHVDNPNTREHELGKISEIVGKPLVADFSQKVGKGK